MKNEQWRALGAEGRLDGVEVLSALGQYQHLAALIERLPDFCGNCCRT